nr:hypothetical protein BSM_02020 [uncultured archaeon]
MQWGNAKGEQYTGNPYVRFDEGTEVVRPPPTLQVGAPCKGATPSESSIRGIRTYGSMRGRRSKDLLLLYRMGLPSALICVNLCP